MFEINAVLVLGYLNCIVRGTDGLPGNPEDKSYREWLRKLVHEHEVVLGENSYRKYNSKGNGLSFGRLVVLAKRENTHALEKAAKEDPSKIVFVPRISLLGGGTSFAEIIRQKGSDVLQNEKRKRKLFILGGPHTLYRLAGITDRLYLTRMEQKGDAYMWGEYRAHFPKEVGPHGHSVIYGK